MKLFDVYKSKSGNQVIQIEGFATHINRGEGKEMIIVYSHIGVNGGVIGSSPSFNGYGSQLEIEDKYKLLVASENLKDYDSWEDILALN